MENVQPQYKSYYHSPIGQPNQLRRELLDVCSLNCWPGADSAGRKQMMASHLGQRLTLVESGQAANMTGMELEFGDYTYKIEVPADITVIKVIDRYRRTPDKDSIEMNPQSIVIYENDETKEIGVIDIAKFCTNHQYFGFEYKVNQNNFSKLRAGENLPKGAILMDSPNKKEDGNYHLGRPLMTAFMTHEGTAEDGIVISRSVLKKWRFKLYETRVVSFGSKEFPLNTYGTHEFFKAFPDIGEYVREDGLLIALRSFDEDLAPVEQGVNELLTINPFFDRLTYVKHGRGRVVDIRVQHELTPSGPTCPEGMSAQALKYDKQRREFYQAILDTEQQLRKTRREQLRLTPEFHNLVVEAISVVGHNTRSPNERIRKTNRKDPMDDFRIEFIIEHEIVPTEGFKLTDLHGGKGVICHIREEEDMPIDQWGNRAEAIMDGFATINRMNLGRFIETLLTASYRDTVQRIKNYLSLTGQEPNLLFRLQMIQEESPSEFDTAWGTLMDLYGIVSPEQQSWFFDGSYKGSKVQHLEEVLKNGIVMYVPPENEPEILSIAEAIIGDPRFAPNYAPVWVRNAEGEMELTADPVLISDLYCILLEKIADDGAAVSSGKVQHHGVLSQVTPLDKYATPTRQSSTRALGEAEVRIMVSYTSPEITADILDRSNNPETHEVVCENIINTQYLPEDAHLAHTPLPRRERKNDGN